MRPKANNADRLAAIHAKLQDGKKLTAAEKRFLAQSKAEARYVPTLEEVASYFGVVRKALKRWEEFDTEGALKPTPNGYDIEAIRRLRKRFLENTPNTRLNKGDLAPSDGDDDEDKNDVATLKARKIRLECDKLAVQIDILMGKYALVEDVLAEVRTVIYAVKDKLRRAGPELAYDVSGVTPAEAEDKISAYIHKVLTDLETTDYDALSEKLAKPKEDMERGERVPAARETNGRQRA